VMVEGTCDISLWITSVLRPRKSTSAPILSMLSNAYLPAATRWPSWVNPARSISPRQQGLPTASEPSQLPARMWHLKMAH